MVGISFGSFQSILNDSLSMYQIAAKLVQSALSVLEFLAENTHFTHKT
jgi:N-acetylglucosamine kinase-like BadF-type ATPase